MLQTSTDLSHIDIQRYAYKHHKSIFSGMFSAVLEGKLELDVPTLKEAGVSVYTDSSSSSAEAEVGAKPRLGVNPRAGFDSGCAARAVWETCVSPCWT